MGDEQPIELHPRHLPVWVRPLVGAVAAPTLSVFFAGLLTLDSLGYWENAILDLLAFLVASWLASIVAGRHEVISVGLGMATTWGLIAIVVLLRRSGEGSIRSPIVVLVYVALSTVLAFLLGKRARRTTDFT